jgi:DNA-directed RNA polymerase I, II, and III subunit RPABC1
VLARSSNRRFADRLTLNIPATFFVLWPPSAFQNLVHDFTSILPNLANQPLQATIAFPSRPDQQPPHTLQAEKMDGDVFSKEVVRLWRAWKTVHEMVVDRVCHAAFLCS